MEAVKIKKKTALTKLIAGAFLLIIAYFLLYVSSEERKFMERVGHSFDDKKSDTILVSEVTDFSWDAVCYVAAHSTKSFNFIEDSYQDILKSELSTIPWPIGHGEYYFIKDSSVVKKFSFATWGFRYSQGRLYPAAFTTFIGSELYVFMGEHNSRNDSCITLENAAFVKEHIVKWDERRILITNLEKESK